MTWTLTSRSSFTLMGGAASVCAPPLHSVGPSRKEPKPSAVAVGPGVDASDVRGGACHLPAPKRTQPRSQKPRAPQAAAAVAPVRDGWRPSGTSTLCLRLSRKFRTTLDVWRTKSRCISSTGRNALGGRRGARSHRRMRAFAFSWKIRFSLTRPRSCGQEGNVLSPCVRCMPVSTSPPAPHSLAP